MSRLARLSSSTASVAAAFALVFFTGAGAEAATAVPPAALSGRHCVVPKLIGTDLKTAKRRLRAADCRIGAVRKIAGASAIDGKVIAQGFPPGTVRPSGARIGVALDG